MHYNMDNKTYTQDCNTCTIDKSYYNHNQFSLCCDILIDSRPSFAGLQPSLSGQSAQRPLYSFDKHGSFDIIYSPDYIHIYVSDHDNHIRLSGHTFCNSVGCVCLILVFSLCSFLILSFIFTSSISFTIILIRLTFFVSTN